MSNEFAIPVNGISSMRRRTSMCCPDMRFAMIGTGNILPVEFATLLLADIGCLKNSRNMMWM